MNINADTSLYIPDNIPSDGPVSTGVLGVGSDGRTTWPIPEGTPSGTFTTDGSPPAACGSTNSYLALPCLWTILFIEFSHTGRRTQLRCILCRRHQRDLTAGLAAFCTINNGNAVCVKTATYSGQSAIFTTISEIASPVPIQGSETILSTAASATSGSSQASAGSSPASSSTQPPTVTATGKPNSTGRGVSTGGLGLFVVAGSAISYFLL
jgi:hypothetical protein